MKKLQKKRVLLFGGILCVLSLVASLTIAYNHDRSVIGNEFGPSVYKTATTEQFDSPSNWQPCDEKTKTVFVKNEGSVNVRVRVKYDEVWRDAADTKNLPLEKDGVRLVNVALQNLDDWELRDNGYYYYKHTLAPGESTNSLFKKVVFDCNANLGAENVCENTAAGMTCTKPEDDYEGAKYHLKITAETIQEDAADEWTNLYNIIASQANDPSYQIDFTRRAQISDDVSVRNGNGVNKYTEKGQDVYYFRGVVDNNIVLWANQCWKIMRTTYTGGIKMIYNGPPKEINGVMQCDWSTRVVESLIGNYFDPYSVNSNDTSPADVGYMTGTRIENATLTTTTSQVFKFSNSVSRDGDTYTLNTTAGHALTGSWQNTREAAATRYHYFCTNGAAVCSSAEIGYIHLFTYWRDTNTIYYLPIGGYDDIEAAKTAMFANENDSAAKQLIESWFSNNFTSAQEDQLEDAIYCNDRSIAIGSLKGENTNASDTSYLYNYFGAFSRLSIKNADGNVAPSLECGKHDSFTKSDTTNGNGKLNHKVGMPSADELNLAGRSYFDGTTSDYLGNSNYWSMSPSFFNYDSAWQIIIDRPIMTNLWTGTWEGVRPVISFKSGTHIVSGQGTKTSPYIVE